MSSIASWIISERERLGLSQGELAEKVGVGQQAVSNWERGKTEPGKGTMEQLTKVFQDAPPARSRHLHAVREGEGTDRSRTPMDFTWERFAVEVFEPRMKKGPLSTAEVMLLRDAALTIYGLTLGEPHGGSSSEADIGKKAR